MEYYFENEEIKKAFKKCVAALHDELSMSNAMNLNEICTIIDEIHSEELYTEYEILVEISNIKEVFENILEECKLNKREIFMTDSYIEDRIDYFLDNQEEFSNRSIDFSISLVKKGEANELFSVLFSTIQELEDDELIFEDFDYTDFTDAIDNIIEDNEKFEEYEFSHVGGDDVEGKTFIDIYYDLKLKTKTFGFCPVCAYELNLEDSDYAPTSNESDELIKKKLLEYHYEANPRCKEAIENKICQIADQYQKEIDFYINDATYDSFLSGFFYEVYEEIDNIEIEVKERLDNLKLEYKSNQ